MLYNTTAPPEDEQAHAAYQMRKLYKFAQQNGNEAVYTPCVLRAHGEEHTGLMEFGTHFFPTLAHSSNYFRSVKGMLECVDANILERDPAK